MNNTSPKRERVTKSKAMITIRLDPSQYNQVVDDANAHQVSLNEYCLRKLEVSHGNKLTGKRRGRKPKLLPIELKPEACHP